MKTSLILAGLLAVTFAQTLPIPYLSVFDDTCVDPSLPAPIFNGLADAGILAHNDFHDAGETGSVYHTYSINEGVLSNDGELCLDGTVTANFGANTIYAFEYCCSTVGGMFPGPMTGNDCTGSYGPVTITGKANEDGNEFLFHIKDDEYLGEGWFTFPVEFDPTVDGNGDFVIKVGCPPEEPEPFCGDGIVNGEEKCDYNDPDAPDGCRGEDGTTGDADCTYCGDEVVQDGLEVCDNPNDPTACDANCQIPQAPGCPFDFDGVLCGDWDLTNGHADGGIYARNSFWNDWDARPFLGGTFSYCPGNTEEAPVLALAGTFDNNGQTCDISYSCTVVNDVSAQETTGTSCSGVMTCGADSLAISGKSNGSSEVACFTKYEGDPWTCLGWIEWSTGPSEEEFAVGDIVWTGICIEDEETAIP